MNTHRATLRIFGDNLDFEAIRESLGLVETRSHRKGERRSVSLAPYVEDAWLYTPPVDEEAELDVHLGALREALADRVAELLELKKHATVDVVSSVNAGDDIGGVVVSLENLRFLVELELGLGVSFILGLGPPYVPCEEEEEAGL